MRHLRPILLASVLGFSACQAQEPKASPSATTSQIESQPSNGAQQGLREEIYDRARQRNEGKEPTKLQLLNELMAKAAEETSRTGAKSQPRVVTKGGRPELILHEGKILIEGKTIALGDPLDAWKKAIPTTPRCSAPKNDSTLCIWDELGIAVGSSPSHPNKSKFLNVSLNLEPVDPLFPDRPRPLVPKKAFPGYLELDGFGIDAKTEFWEIKAKADPARRLKCGARDCSHPHGDFDEKSTIYIRLNSSSDTGNVYEFSVSADQD